MESVVIFFLGFSLVLYVLFAGADFGAGIIELSAPRLLKQQLQGITYRAIGPVWEANHIWLIVFIVILFVAFPQVYSRASIYLHIPLSLMLLGIFVRGCAFTFRHYDAVQDGSQHYYTLLFRYSSFLTPLWLGICLGAVIQGRFVEVGQGDFYIVYIAPWANVFCLLVGLLFCAICAMLAAGYLVGEAVTEYHRAFFIKRTLQTNAIAALLGGGVLVFGYWDSIAIFRQFDLVFGLCFLGAFVGYVLTLMYRQTTWGLRITTALQVVCVLLGWMLAQAPVLFQFSNGVVLRVEDSIAPYATVQFLGGGLLLVSALVVPSLLFLLYVFKAKAH